MAPLFSYNTNYSGNIALISSGSVYLNASGNTFLGPYSIISGVFSTTLTSDDAFYYPGKQVNIIPATIGFNVGAFDYLLSNPTEVVILDFQPPKPSGLDLSTTGTILLNNLQFESPSDLVNFNITSSGSVNSSGILSPGLIGSSSLGIQSGGDGILDVKTNLSTTSGIKSGRMCWVHKLPNSNNSSKSLTYAFVQDTNLNTYGVKVSRTNNNYFNVDFIKSTYSGLTYATPLNYSNTLVPCFRLLYSFNVPADNAVTRWWGLDWDYREDGVGLPVLIWSLYTKTYINGDTLDTFKTQAYPVAQAAIYLPSGGSNNWTTFNNNFQQSFILQDNSATSEATRIDNVYLEKFNNLTSNYGLHTGKIIYENINISGAFDYNSNYTSFASLSNCHVGDTTASGNTEGILRSPSNQVPMGKNLNYLNPSTKDYFSNAGYGNSGLLSATESSITRQLRYYLANSTNILHGAVRVLFKRNDNAFGQQQTNTAPNDKQFEVVVNRTGSINNNQCYKFVIMSNSNNSFVLFIYKHTSPSTITLLTSTSVTDTGGNIPLWLEFRWKTNISSVQLEVLRGSVDNSLSTFDNPQQVYFKLSTIATATDSSSPILTAPENIAIMQGAAGAGNPKLLWLGLKKHG